MASNQERITFRKHDKIGANDAEEDHLLANCFVDTGDIKELRDCTKSARIVVGRTGAGKTALLRKLLETEDRAIEIRPENLALSYISNSGIINFFEQMGVNLDVFYKLIWRHAFCVELLRSRFNLTNSDQKVSLLAKLKASFVGGRYAEAIKYLEDWGDRFWETIDIRVKEITRKVETTLEDSLKGEIDTSLIKAGAQTGAIEKLSEDKKLEIVNRGTAVVNQNHVPQLNQLLDVVAALLDDEQKRYFLVIDRLDENWVDERLRSKLIMALIDTVKEFRRVRNAKIIVAMRMDLLRRVFTQVRPAGFQEEKIQTLCLKLRWDERALVQLIEERINEVFKDRYAEGRRLTCSDVLVETKNATTKIADYIFERTLMRPRDVIAFWNECIEAAEGQTRITFKHVRQAELSYSRGRLQSICDEWRGSYPALEKILRRILTNKPHSFRLGTLLDGDGLLEICLELSMDPLVSSEMDELSCCILDVNSGAVTPETGLTRIAYVLYVIGAFRVKSEANLSLETTATDLRPLDAASLTLDRQVHVHPMLWSALNVQTPQR